MSLMEFFLILRARSRMIYAVAIGVVVLTALVSLILPKYYLAESALVVDSKNSDVLTGTMQPMQVAASYLATQIDIISSHNVALKVVRKLKLTQLPGMREKFESKTDGQGSMEDWLADKLLQDLNVSPSRDSNVLTIGFYAVDPQLSADIANSFADAYIQTSLELKVDPARRQSAWFDEQIQNLRKSLESAQQSLSAYQQNHGIIAIDDRLDVENSRLTEISTQLVEAQAATYDYRSRLQQANNATSEKRLRELPDILNNPLLQNMKADLARSEAKLAELSERFDRNHPARIAAMAEVESLRGRIAQEIETAKGSIRGAEQMASRRADELSKALEDQKQKVLTLKQQHDEISVLQRDVENARNAYDSTLQRAGQVRLESQLDQTNIAILNTAIAPLEWSKPKLKLNLALALVLGVLLGIGAALVAEFFDPRIRSASDLVNALQLPVLVELTSGVPARAAR